MQFLGAEEMVAWWVKCLLSKCDYPSLDPWYSRASGSPVLECGNGSVLEASWPASLAEVALSKFSERPQFRKRNRGEATEADILILTSDLCTCQLR